MQFEEYSYGFCLALQQLPGTRLGGGWGGGEMVDKERYRGG